MTHSLPVRKDWQRTSVLIHADSRAPSHSHSASHWLLCIPRPSMTSCLPSQKTPSVCFLYSKPDFFSSSATSVSKWRHDRLVKASSSNHFPQIVLRGFRTQGSPAIYMAANGTCWLHFTLTSLVLSFQEVYFSVTRTIYLGLHTDGHSLLQVCSQSSASIHFFCSCLRISVLYQHKNSFGSFPYPLNQLWDHGFEKHTPPVQAVFAIKPNDPSADIS